MRIIYVDDEYPALDNFRLTCMSFSEIKSLNMFTDGSEAVEWVKNNPTDAAFLDMEMPGIHGLELAKKLKEINTDIGIVFVTAYSQYALDAWGVDATEYLLKPYTASDIRKELSKCKLRSLPEVSTVIETIPKLSIKVNGKPLHFSGSKPREMFAFLVDRGESGFTAGECISYLWPERSDDAKTHSLCRMTYKRLCDTLNDAGIGDIIESKGNRRYLKTNLVDCDLYKILAGDMQARKKYNGSYLEEYSWAEERNGMLYRMIF